VGRDLPDHADLTLARPSDYANWTAVECSLHEACSQQPMNNRGVRFVSRRSWPTMASSQSIRCLPFRCLLANLLAACSVSLANAAPLDRELDTDGFDPAAESYRINEARRMNEINRQLELKYRMLWAHGFDPASPPVEQPLGHEYQQTGPNRWEYRPVYPEEVQPGQSGPEILPAPGERRKDSSTAQPPLLIAPQPQSAPIPTTRPQVTPAPANAPAPRDAIPTDRLVPQKHPRKAKSSGPREF
jgi:hypothetical protein